MARSRLLMALYALYGVTLTAVLVAAVAGFDATEKIAGPGMLVFDIVAVVFGVRACRHPGLDRLARRTAWAITAALVSTLGVSLTFMVTGTGAFPQIGDGLHLLATPIFFVAFLLMPLRRATRRERWKTLLDVGTVVLGASMVLWYLVVGPALVHPDASDGLILAAACYPVVDLLVLFGLARVLLRGTGQISRRTTVMIAVAMLALLVGNTYLGYRQAHTAGVSRTTVDFVCWLTCHFGLACAAVELWRQAAHPAVASDRKPRSAASKLPYVAVGVGYLLMATAALRESEFFPWTGLVAGGVGITALVVLRQVLAQQEITEAAETDALTGLANRARLHHELARALHRAERTGQPVAVLLIDLNGFKQINDTLGHQAGDGLLVAVADAMRRSVRPDDLVGRIGGDEFAVVAQSVTDAAGAGAVAQRITEAIAGPFVVGETPMSAAASIGVAVNEPGGLTPDALLHRADVAMYDLKRRGSGWQAWRPGLGGSVTDALTTDLAAAIERDQLHLSYRPIRSVGGEIVGADTEIGWTHPEQGEIEPELFLRVAERDGIAEKVGAWALRRAVIDAAGWGGPRRYVCVRLPSRHLRRPRFVAEVAELLSAEDLEPSDLVLEVSECTPKLTARLVTLRTLGIRVAVRGFGTAYTDVRSLSALPVDMVRLAGLGGAGDVPVAEAVIRLHQSLGLATLIDDVEVPADADDLGALLTRGKSAMI